MVSKNIAKFLRNNIDNNVTDQVFIKSESIRKDYQSIDLNKEQIEVLNRLTDHDYFVIKNLVLKKEKSQVIYNERNAGRHKKEINLSIEEIMKKRESGQSMKSIAAECHVSRSKLYTWLEENQGKAQIE